MTSIMDMSTTRVCKACRLTLAIEQFHWSQPGVHRRHKCKTCYSAEQAVKFRTRYASNPGPWREKVKAHRASLSLAGKPEQRRIKPNGKVRPDEYFEHRRKYGKQRRADLQEETFAAYGGMRCACCGETEPLFLSLDHIEGNGNKHRQETGTRGGGKFYEVLKKAGYPAGYRVLCMNCNCGRHRNGGKCPHEGPTL